MPDMHNISGVRANMGTPSPRPVIGNTSKPRSLNRWFSMAWLVLPTLVVVLVVFILMKWPAPTEVEIDMIATSVQFRGHGADKQVLLESMPARWLALQGFAEIRLSPETVWVVDPAKHDFQHDTYPSNAWSPLLHGQPLVLRPVGRSEAAVTIQPFAKSDGSLRLGRIFAGSADITLRSPERGSLSVELRGENLDGDVPLPEEFRMDADRCAREGASLAPSGSPMTLRVRLSQSSRLLEYSSQPSGMRLAVAYPAGDKESFLGKDGFAVDQVRFLGQGPTGQPESTLAGAGVIRYVRYTSARLVPLSEGDFLNLDDLSGFHVREIAPNGDTRSLRMHLGGVAGKISSGPVGSIRDRRLTYFDNLWQNPIIATLFTILAWVVPTLIGARNLYRNR